jgi:hypothetical protein
MCMLKGLSSGMRLYTQCHFYFFDLLPLIIVDKIFCNESLTKNFEKNSIHFAVRLEGKC